MRNLLLLVTAFLFVFNNYCIAQDTTHGVSNLLNREEAAYLNNALQNNRGDFNFEDKQVAFITGSSGAIIVTKETYFEEYAKSSDDRRVASNMFMVLLTKDEKTTSGGYDALVFTWVKVAFSNKQKQKIIERLKEQTMANN